MRGPWIKVFRHMLKDEKIAFLMRRYGHEALTFWVGFLTECEDGVLYLEEDIFADVLQIEEKRYQELRAILIKRGLLIENQDGRLESPTWDEYQLGESTERVRQYRERQRAAKSGAEAQEWPAPESPDAGNGDETLPKREGNGAETTEEEVDVEGEAERKDTHTAHAREEQGQEEEPRASGAGDQGQSFAAPGESAMPRAVFNAWSALGDRVFQPGDFATAFAARWSELRRSIRGVHSDDVLAAIKNFGSILTGPPGRYYWNQRITLQAFFERHLEKFIPANFRPEDFLARAGAKSEAPPGRHRSPEELAKLRSARELIYGKAATDEWYTRQCEEMAG